jgi:large subunit ribosomal protein L29
MNAADLRAKDVDGLKEELNGLLKAQFSIRMQVATQQLSSTAQIKSVRKDIARVKTLLTEKKRSA